MDGAEGQPTVQIFGKLFGSHSKNLERALDKTSQRAGLIGKNLANINTPGYKRFDTEFGIALEKERGAFGNRTAQMRSNIGSKSPSGLNNFRTGKSSMNVGIDNESEGVYRNESNVRIDGSSVDLETEVMAMTETQLRYEMLADITGRYFSGLKNVIREGR